MRANSLPSRHAQTATVLEQYMQSAKDSFYESDDAGQKLRALVNFAVLFGGYAHEVGAIGAHKEVDELRVDRWQRVLDKMTDEMEGKGGARRVPVRRGNPGKKPLGEFKVKKIDSYYYIVGLPTWDGREPNTILFFHTPYGDVDDPDNVEKMRSVLYDTLQTSEALEEYEHVVFHTPFGDFHQDDFHIVPSDPEDYKRRVQQIPPEKRMAAERARARREYE